MSGQYNLDQEAAKRGDYFTFILGGKQYQFRYPTVEESESIQKLAEGDEPDVEAMTKAMYKFVMPVDDAPPIDKAMRKVTSPVLKEFNKMLNTELAVE